MKGRTERITVRFTASEESWIIQKADEAGVSKSRFLRQVSLGERPQVETPFYPKNRKLKFNNGVSTEDMEKLLDYDISKVGNNLNQIARKLNEGVPADDKMAEQIREIREEMNKITDTILTALS